MNRLFCLILIAASISVAGCANKAPEQLSSQADTLIAGGKYKRALKYYDEAISKSDKDSALFAKRATVKSLLMDYEGALSDYNRAIELRPDVGWYHSKRAMVLAEMHQPEEAIRSADKALELDPADLQTYAYRANAYSQQGQYERGLKDALLTKRAGDLLYSYKVLATCYVHLGKPDEALDSIRKAITLNEKEPELFCLKSEAEMLKLDLKQAVRSAEVAQKLNDKAIEPYSCLARAYMLSGNYDAAKENIDQVSSRSRIDGQALLTVYYMSTNKVDQALESAIVVAKERPSPESQLTLAEVYTLAGNCDEALKICKGLEKEYPDLPSIQRSKAMALIGLERYDEADAACSRSIQSLAYNPVAYRLRSEARTRNGDSTGASSDRAEAEKLGYTSTLPQERILVSLQKQLADRSHQM